MSSSCDEKKKAGLCKKNEAKKINDKLVDVYRQYLELRFCEPGPGELAEYDWYSLPNELPFRFYNYSIMLGEYAQGLSNSINELNRYVVTLKTWDKVLRNIDDDFRFKLMLEMIDPIASIAINLPRIIKKRAFFSIAHLCHQVNMSKEQDWSEDKLPNDDKIEQEHADNAGKRWRKYCKTKVALEKIDNKNYSEKTKQFRNKYNHRFPPNIEEGHTGLSQRRIDEDGRWEYGIGGFIEPLPLSLIVSLLSDQYKIIISAYNSYQKLILSQVDFIEKKTQAMNLPKVKEASRN